MNDFDVSVDKIRGNTILYIIPQDPENKTDLLNVDMATKEDVRRLFKFFVSNNWHCNTIANSVIENLIRSLSLELRNTRNSNAKINFYDLFEAYVTVKRDENAEKEGNINIAFKALPKMEEIIADNTPREDREYVYTSPAVKFGYGEKDPRTKAMLLLDRISRKELNDKNAIVLPNEWMAISIGYIFIENIIRELIKKITLTNKPSASINFNDNIEFHAIVKNEGLVISMRPGMNAKLLIKSDELTEIEDNDGDDD